MSEPNNTAPTQLTADQLDELKKQLAGLKTDSTYQRPRNTPMAKLLGEISDFLSGYDTADDRIGLLYDRVDAMYCDSTDKRLSVVRQIVTYFYRVHEMSVPNEDTKFISIPLYGMKTIERLLNVLIIEGVYSSLPDCVGIPLEKRRLQNFTIPLEIHRVSHSRGVLILESIADTFIKIFTEKSDLRDLIQVGSGFTDVLTLTIVLSIDPLNSNEKREKYASYVEQLEKASSTYQLLSLYTLLMATPSAGTALSSSFRQFVLARLSGLLVERRANGVQAMIDVVMGLRDNDRIDTSRIQQVLRVIFSSKPRDMGNEEYFENICGQLYDLMVYVNRPVMTAISAAVIESIFDKNKLIVIDFIFKRIWKAFNPEVNNDTDSIVLTSESQLNNAFNVCISFSRQVTSKRFSNILFQPVIVPLWGYLVYQKGQKKDAAIVEDTLISILLLEETDQGCELLMTLIGNLFCLHGTNWVFANGDNNLTMIKESLGSDNPPNNEAASLAFFDDVDTAIETFSTILKSLAGHDPQKIDFVFIFALKKWLKLDDGYQMITYQEQDPFDALTNLKLVQMIVEKFKDQLAASPDGVLGLVMTLLKKSDERIQTKSRISELSTREDSDDEDEEDLSRESDQALRAVMDFLSGILASASDTENYTEATFERLKELENILSSSSRFSEYAGLREQVKRIIDNCDLQALRDTTKKHEEDRLLDKAMKCINDPIPSVRVYGMDLIRQLADPSVHRVSLKYAVNLHLDQLTDNDPFVYLNIIKGMESLLELDVKSVLPQYLDVYSGKSERSTDERLRIGEVLLRFVQKHGSYPSDEVLHDLLTTLIALVSKRDDDTRHVDIRLRMSAMSITGSLCHGLEEPEQLKPYLKDVIDLVSGVLTFERSKEESIMRRSAIVVINDLITSKDGLRLVGPYGPKLETMLQYIAENDVDLLVRQQAKEVLYATDESFERAFKEGLRLQS
ncbi:DEKNAAC100575 [Brettanomyces naardenensis]|uniref:DEKNAAC100575 n=1 Tax=Brettanomyces naardenensis TaxID=13370 RepID=A0A448YFL9_BRENA|nr:DEKNAAC100575 [Brettanomyces naardenensis]